MAKLLPDVSHTFNEYLLIPGHTTKKCIPDNVSLCTPLVKYKKGETPSLTMNIPMVSAIMQSVSGNRLAVALAAEGGVAFIFGAQPIASQAEMVRKAKSYKAGFVPSDSNIKPDATLADVLELKNKTQHSTMAVTEDGTPDGKLLGIVTSRDYRVSRMSEDALVRDFMTPRDKLITAPAGTGPFFSNRAHRRLHRASARSASRSRELLNVSRAEMPYSFIRAAAASGSASPNPALPPSHRQPAGAP